LLFDRAGNRLMVKIFLNDLQIEAFDKTELILNKQFYVQKRHFSLMKRMGGPFISVKHIVQ